MSPFLIVSLLTLTSVVHSQTSHCSTLTSSACERDGYCSLNSNSDCICGGTQWNQDIAFIFDSSMTPLQWTHSTTFAADLLYYASPSYTTTRTALFQTANSSIPSTLTLSFDQESILTTIHSTLPNLKQTNQTNLYLQLSLQNALDLFLAQSTTNTRKILIIFASQSFKQSPCQINMRSHDISTYTITMGGFNTHPFQCIGTSENNYEGLLTITDSAQLTDIFADMESISCPHKPLLKFTEIQFAGENGLQYVEIYNYGHDITDMSQFQLFEFGTGVVSAVQLNQGSYAIIYNTDNRFVGQEILPNCVDCACTESALTVNVNVKWCADVVYLGCCVNINNGCTNYAFETVSDCQFNTDLSMTSFTVTLRWTNPNNQIRQSIGTLSFDASLHWPVTGNNYALELKNIGFNAQFGSSWAMSCDTTGTPGDKYLSIPCAFDCAIDGISLCNLNGGMSANQCIGTSCDCLDGFYAHYQTCLALPLVDNCVAIEQGSLSSNTSYSIAPWDGDTTYLFFHCEQQNGCINGQSYSATVTALLTYVLFDQGRDINATLITLQTLGTDGNTHISEPTICSHVTSNPTQSPTLSPTYSIPVIPECSISLTSDLKTFEIVWTGIDRTLLIDSDPPTSAFDGYIYYYNDVAISGINCCTSTISNSLTFNLNSDWVSVSGSWDESATGITDSDQLQSATVCSVITVNPTFVPSNSPTLNPTLKPTINPTHFPTESPTLVELYVGACVGTALKGSAIVNMSWTEANFGINTALKADTYYIIEWMYKTDKENGYREIPAIQGTQKLVEIDDYINVNRLQMYCTWSSFTQQGRETSCDGFTLSPTPSPTPLPSTPPTPAPLNVPTLSPVPIPTPSPTHSPTYTFDSEISWCHATFPVQPHNTIVVTWELLYTDENNPEIAPANWIKYVAITGDDTTIISQHINQRCNDTNPTQCWGFNPKSLTPDSDGKYVIAPVTFYAEYINNGVTVMTTNIINCSIDTPMPTHSPTLNPTMSPTMMPTAGPVSIYLHNTGCPDGDGRCGCDAQINSECCTLACDWNAHPAPIITVKEKDGLNTTFYVRRNIENYPFQISVQFKISAVTEALAQKYGFHTRLEQIEKGDISQSFLDEKNISNNTTGLNITYTIPTDCYFTNWDSRECEYYINDNIARDCSIARGRDCDWCDFYPIPGPRCNDITPNDGKFIIPYSELNDGNTFKESKFELSILTDGCETECDWKGEVFLLELMSCSVLMNDSSVNNDLDCSLMYPSRAYIIVTDQDTRTRQEYINIPDSKYDDWLWYVILGGVVLLTAAAYIIVTWWRNKKIGDAHSAQREITMEPVLDEEETFMSPETM